MGLNFSLSVEPESTLPFTIGVEGQGLTFSYKEFTPRIDPTLSVVGGLQSTPDTFVPDSGTVLQPSNLHSMTVPQTVCRVGGLDVSSALDNWDYAIGVGKLGSGQASFSLNPGVPRGAFVLGAQVVIQLKDGTDTLEDIRCFIVNEPGVSNAQGAIRVNVTLGSEATLNATQKVTRTYCGLPPKNAKELAEIVCASLGAKHGAFPEGHSLSEVLEDQSFRGLQTVIDAYAVTDYDVYEDFRGYLIAIPHANNRTINIPADSYIKADWQPPGVIPSKVTIVANQYNHDQGYLTYEVETEAYSQNYDAVNTLPWFAGGYTLTKKTEKYVGSTVVKTVSETYGYVPDTFPVLVSDLPNDACVIVSTVPTTFKLIATETITNYFTPVFRTSLILWRTDRVVNGLNAYRRTIQAAIPYEQWDSYTGLIAREVTQYQNTQDTDNTQNLCSFQQLWRQATVKSWQFGILRNNQFALQGINETTYSKGATSKEPYGSFVKRPALWTKNSQVTRYDEVHGHFNTTPVFPEGITDPPNSVFLSPYREQVQVEGSYVAPPGIIVNYTHAATGTTCPT